MRLDTRIFLVGVLVFLFPLLFVWVTQSFFTTAYTNIHTGEKLRVGMLHDSLQAIVQSDTANAYEVLQTFLASVTSENPDITKIRLYEATEDGFIIRASNEAALVGTYDPDATLLSEIGFSDTLDFQQFEYHINDERIWQAFRRIPVEEGFVYSFSEHNLSTIDRTMAFRKQQSYYGLTAIFIFLIALAYWLNRQVYWQKRHNRLAVQLSERDQFSNMIAHEFRTPLTAIKGYASFLQESRALPAEEQRYADNIRVSAERLVILVNDFLEVALIQAGKIKLDTELVDLRTLVDAVGNDLTPLATEKGLTLTIRSQKQPLFIKTDRNRMIQVLTNIISNAVKYTEKGSVDIECTQSGGQAIVRVKDTGTGISAADQQKLFTPFTRVGGADKGSVTGSGLGMWITKQLIELLGGTIGVESIKDVGTHVVLTFPAE